jgi:hypothetical protein
MNQFDLLYTFAGCLVALLIAGAMVGIAYVPTLEQRRKETKSDD